ncbi:MAG: hypothetical protein ACJ762_11185 [Solirubrobacteraceae bacterium]
MVSTRDERLARNETEFRTANEAMPTPTRTQANYFCECSDRDCTAFVAISADEYRRVRRDPMQFVVVPGHERLDIETVVESDERFRIVHKDEDVRHIVDPD